MDEATKKAIEESTGSSKLVPCKCNGRNEDCKLCAGSGVSGAPVKRDDRVHFTK